MKIKQLLFMAMAVFLFSACSNTKNISMADKLSGNTWELEYISGPRIAFAGLYPDKKPMLTFNTATKEARGTNSCNGYSAKYTSEGQAISFGEPGPTTMMFCEGGGDQTFLSTMKKVNKYGFDSEGKLLLMIDDVPMMRFKKSN